MREQAEACGIMIYPWQNEVDPGTENSVGSQKTEQISGSQGSGHAGHHGNSAHSAHTPSDFKKVHRKQQFVPTLIKGRNTKKWETRMS